MKKHNDVSTYGNSIFFYETVFLGKTQQKSECGHFHNKKPKQRNYDYNPKSKNNPNSCGQYLYHNASKQTNSIREKLLSP